MFASWRRQATPSSPLPGAGSRQPIPPGLQSQGPRHVGEREVAGTHHTFGRFKAVHMGDRTWNKEHDLMCPSNRLGTVDLFIVSHHGQAISNAEGLVHALQPRVAIINNGTRKGGQPRRMRCSHVAVARGSLAHPLPPLSGQEHRAWAIIANGVDEQPPRCRSRLRLRRHQDRAERRRWRTWVGLLDQVVGEGRRVVYGDERPERVQQDVRGTLKS